MSMQQRNTVVSLVIFTLILAYFGQQVLQMVQAETFTAPNLFRLWGFVIIAAIVVTIVGFILTNIGSAIVHTVTTGKEPTDEHFLEDERDKLIALKGTQVTYMVYSLGVLAAMIAFVVNQAPLMLFSLLIAAGLVSQIVGDGYRLFRYGTGN